jgi:hypothetical protein
MLHSRIRVLCIALTAITLFASTAARARDAGASDAVSTTLNVLQPLTIGGTTVKPGTYTVNADSVKVTFVSHGKTIAQANVQWRDSDQKSKSTNLLAQDGAIKEIHFSGKTRYVEIAN